MDIIDAHAHISDTTYGHVSLYLDQLKETGIAQGVVVPGGMLDVRKMTDYITGNAEPENPVPDNSYVQAACSDHSGVLAGMVCIDPHQTDALDTLEKGFNAGFRGLKLSPMSHRFSFASKAVAELIDACVNYELPVYSHVVYSPGASTAKFVSLAKMFPKTNFILGHMGFGPADREGLEAALKLNNFFLETSSGSFLHIKEAVRRAGPDKIIFGSEFPLSHPKAELEKILILNLQDDDMEKILCRNIHILLGLG